MIRASRRRGIPASAEILSAVTCSLTQARKIKALKAYRPSLLSSNLKARLLPRRSLATPGVRITPSHVKDTCYRVPLYRQLFDFCNGMVGAGSRVTAGSGCTTGASTRTRHARELAQIDVEVAKLGRVDMFPRFDQRHRAAQVLPPVDRHDREDPPVLSVERREVSLLHAAPHDELVPLGVEPGVLEVMLVLIGPEPGDLIVGLVLLQHVPGRGRTLLQRVLPVLHAYPAPEHRMVVVGNITRRVDALHVRPAVLVDDDAVVDLRAGVSQEIRGRLDAEAHHYKVALDATTAPGNYPLHAAGALECSHRVLEDHGRPVVAVNPFHHPADLLAENPAQRHLIAVHDDDIHPRLPERRRHLRADKAHPHHYCLASRGDLRANTVGVGHRAQAMDAFQIQARNGKMPVPPPGGDEKLVIGHTLPIVELDHPLGGVYPRGPNPEPGLDAVLLVEVGRLYQRLIERGLAAEVLLGQRRPLVRRLRLRPDQDHPPVKALLPQGGRRSPTRQAGADDHERLGRQPLNYKLPPPTLDS